MADFDVDDFTHRSWRARCEKLAAQHLNSVVDVRVIEVDALDLNESVVEQYDSHEPAA